MTQVWTAPVLTGASRPGASAAGRAVWLGAWAALGAWVLVGSWIAGAAVFALSAAVAMLMRARAPAVLLVCFVYQWCFVVSGWFYRALVAPGGGPPLGDLDRAVVLSVVGFVVMAGGLWLVAAAAGRGRPVRPTSWVEAAQSLDVRRLFWVVAALFLLDYVTPIVPRAFWPAGAQLVSRALEFRYVVLCLLLFVAVWQGRYRYGAYGLVVVMIPSFASPYSTFKEPLFMLLAVLVSVALVARSEGLSERVRKLVGAVAIVSVGLGIAGIVWEGAVKSAWRSTARSGASTRPVDDVARFAVVAQRAAVGLRPGVAIEDLTQRISSGVEYFGATLYRVPSIVPFTGGTLTARAVRHVLEPRVLFPHKQDLGGDSWMVREYAGVAAAGADEGTSVGLTYMAQFYIDFGVPGMFVPLLVLGGMVGLLLELLRRAGTSSLMAESAATTLLVIHFTSYDGEIAKVVGALILGGAVFAVLLRVFGRRFERWSTRRGRPHRALVEPAPRG